jgi:hypothetical protein
MRLGKILEATEHRRGGWSDEAQAARWSCFERALSARHLREYLKRLPEFEDFEAEQRALDHAEQYGSLLQAISFLVSWPPLDRAARTITARAKELDGDHYELLTPAANALTAKYPLAATLLLRAMMDFSLTKSRASRYGHTARHLRECAGLASRIQDYASIETHDVCARITVERLHSGALFPNALRCTALAADWREPVWTLLNYRSFAAPADVRSTVEAH